MERYFSLNKEASSHLLVHIPHASLHIPDDMRHDYLLDERKLEEVGLHVEENFPYRGSMVSNRYNAKEKNVKSVMIELNRRIYMDDVETFQKRGSYDDIKAIIENLFISTSK